MPGSADAALQRSPGGRPIRVVRSTRRRRTIEARVTEGVIEVRIPSWYSEADEADAVTTMVRRLEGEVRLDDAALEERAHRLARRHDLPMPTEVRWSTRQRRRWGSCTPTTGVVRLSSTLATYPAWVVDYVLVHELAHLVHADHSPAFHALVDRYPRAERARGFLLAKGMGDDLVDGHADPDADPEAPRLF